MGNSPLCPGSAGERLLAAARDGDVGMTRMMLELDPRLAAYASFARMQSPLHLAAARGHVEVVAVLLESGVDVNAKNLCGETALMMACHHGHWEVVQTLLLHRPNVTKTEYMSRKTALHFAVESGHILCMRLLVADFIPSLPYSMTSFSMDGEKETSKSKRTEPSIWRRFENLYVGFYVCYVSRRCPLVIEIHLDELCCRELSSFVNKAANGGVTALHIAAIKGLFDCMQLLLDLNANVSIVTSTYVGSMNMIGAGSTPLHYAAYGGNIKCCQILLARGASRLKLNCNGECGFQSSTALSDDEDGDHCAVCLERACNVAAEGCAHELCVKCALYLCSTSKVASETGGQPGSVPCPLCRQGIVSFIKSPSYLQTCSS